MNRFLSFPLVKALCKECVVERCRVLRLKNQLNEDYKTVNNLLKATVKGYVTQRMLFMTSCNSCRGNHEAAY